MYSALIRPAPRPPNNQMKLTTPFGRARKQSERRSAPECARHSQTKPRAARAHRRGSLSGVFGVHEGGRMKLGSLATVLLANLTVPSPPFTTAGWGPVRVGMPVAEVSAALSGAFRLAEGFKVTDGCQYWFAPPVTDIRFMVEEGRVVRIETRHSRYATVSGVRVGDTEVSARRVYAGRAVIKPHKYSTTGHYLVVSTQDGRRAVVVETDDGRVVQIRTGQQPAVEYVEGCS